MKKIGSSGLLIFIFAILVTAHSFFAAAEDAVLQLTVEGSSSSEGTMKAREESLSEALNKGSLQAIGNLIGETRLEKNMPLIKAKILSLRQKFVQYYKASEPQKNGNDTVTSVTMKISIQSLRDILAKEGILYQSEGPATILPVIRFIEKRDNAHSYFWWTEEANTNNGFLREEERSVLHQLDAVFRPKNFFLIDPLSQHYVQWMPQPYRSENPTMDDLTWMGDFFKAQMVISGDVILEVGSQPSNVRANLKLTAYHTANGRVLAEVTRTFENASSNMDWNLGVQQVLKKSFGEVAKDLGAQVFDEWNKGTIGATPLKLAVHGSFGYQDLENLKKQIMIKIGDVKKIRERRFEQGLVLFELDVAGGLSSLTKSFQTSSFDGFRVTVDSSGSDHIDLNWSKVASK